MHIRASVWLASAAAASSGIVACGTESSDVMDEDSGSGVLPDSAPPMEQVSDAGEPRDPPSTTSDAGGVIESAIHAQPVRASNPGCVDDRSPISDSEETPLGFGREHVIGIATGPHSAALTWAGGGQTELSFSFEPTQVYFAESRRDPSDGLAIVRNCRPHLQVEGRARLTTSDGKLDETIADLVLFAMQPGIVQGMVLLRPASIQGMYDAADAANTCFLNVAVHVQLSSQRFSGRLLENIQNSPCGQSDATTGVFPNDRARWDMQAQ